MIAFDSDEGAIGLLLFLSIDFSEPRRLSLIESITSTTVTFLTLNHEPIRACIIDDFNLFIALANEKGAFVEVFPVVSENGAIIVAETTVS